MAIERMVSPEHTPGSQRRFCSSRAEALDVGRDDVRMPGEARARDTGAVQFLDHHRRMAEIAAAAAVFGRQGDAQQALAAGLEPGLAVDLAGTVPLRLARHTLALEEAPRGGAQHFVVFAKDGSIDFQFALLTKAGL